MEAFFPPGTDLSKIPSRMPPPGVTPNFVDPPTLSTLPRIFIYVTLPPMVIFVILRFYTRITITRKVGIDDYLCAAGAVTMIIYCGFTLSFLDNPAGRHMWDIPLSMLSVEYASYSTMMSAVTMIAAMLVKASILLLYRRLFHISMRANVMIWATLFVDVVFYLVTFTLFMYWCIPHEEDWPAGGWLSLSFDQRCTKASSWAGPATGVVGSVVDVAILIIPLTIIPTLRVSWRKKAGILALFIAGSSACVFSIIGAYYRWIISSSPNADITWTGMPIYAMNVGELHIGLISGTMPVVFVLFRRFTHTSLSWLSKLRSSITHRGSAHHNSKAELHDNSPGSSDPELGLKANHPDNQQEQQPAALPKVPKGTLTGLRKWMRNKDRTNPATTMLDATGYNKTNYTDGTSTVMTYVSADYDYHRQLRNTAPARPASNNHSYDPAAQAAAASAASAAAVAVSAGALAIGGVQSPDQAHVKVTSELWVGEERNSDGRARSEGSGELILGEDVRQGVEGEGRKVFRWWRQ